MKNSLAWSVFHRLYKFNTSFCMAVHLFPHRKQTNYKISPESHTLVHIVYAQHPVEKKSNLIKNFILKFMFPCFTTATMVIQIQIC